MQSLPSPSISPSPMRSVKRMGCRPQPSCSQYPSQRPDSAIWITSHWDWRLLPPPRLFFLVLVAFARRVLVVAVHCLRTIASKIELRMRRLLWVLVQRAFQVLTALAIARSFHVAFQFAILSLFIVAVWHILLTPT